MLYFGIGAYVGYSVGATVGAMVLAKIVDIDTALKSPVYPLSAASVKKSCINIDSDDCNNVLKGFIS